MLKNLERKFFQVPIILRKLNFAKNYKKQIIKRAQFQEIMLNSRNVSTEHDRNMDENNVLDKTSSSDAQLADTSSHDNVSPGEEVKETKKSPTADDNANPANDQREETSNLHLDKRKAEQNNKEKAGKRPKLETKDARIKRPGFSAERYNETSYYFENGLRKVYPYFFTFTTFTKGRWVGDKILDVFSREFRAHPAEVYERCINVGSLTVNYEKVPIDYVLKHNDLLANKVHRHEVPVTDQPIKIVEMNDDIVVINKPASIPVHPCGRYRHNTAVFILAKEHNLKDLRTIHRLDRLTSGLLLFGRHPQKAREMEVQIRNREVKKQYVCKVEGRFPDQPIECNEPIKVVSYKIGVCSVSPDGKDCKTTFEKLHYDGKTSIVLCRPLTGRMHQIRVHLQYLGYPIVNDPLYNHEVFGPSKGKGGDIGGKTEEQLINDLITIHNAENWLGGEADSDTLIFRPPKDIAESDTLKEPIGNGKAKLENDVSSEKVDDNAALEMVTNETIVNTAAQTDHHSPDSSFDPDKVTKDDHCYECKVNYTDPRPSDLIMYLHAWKYEGPNWKYETDLPAWALYDESLNLQ